MLWNAEETQEIIAAATAVHRALGPGFLEIVYERAMAVELTHRRIAFQRQVRVPIHYRGTVVATHVADMVVDNRIVVELKAVADLEDIHYATLRSYLRAMGRDIGLLLNFSKTTLQIKRVSTYLKPRP